MSPVTHFFAGWLLAAPTALSRREKAAIVCAGVAPDLDGLGAIPELLTRTSSHPLLWFSEYHHALHTLAFALLVATAAWLCSWGPGGFAFGPSIQKPAAPSRPWTTALLVFISFHLHLLCDLIGSRGPDGYSWPIPYLSPFSGLQFSWHGGWALNGWQNIVITCALVALTLWIAWKNGSSPLELVSNQANKVLVNTLRRRFALAEAVAPGRED